MTDFWGDYSLECSKGYLYFLKCHCFFLTLKWKWLPIQERTNYADSKISPCSVNALITVHKYCESELFTGVYNLRLISQHEWKELYPKKKTYLKQALTQCRLKTMLDALPGGPISPVWILKRLVLVFINACCLLSALPSLSQFGRGRLSLVTISFYVLLLLFGPCRLLEFTLAGPNALYCNTSLHGSPPSCLPVNNILCESFSLRLHQLLV